MIAAVALSSCSQGGSSDDERSDQGTTESGIVYTVITATEGEKADSGATVTMHYRGTLTDSTEFDNSYKRPEPFSFVLGKGQVIKGWDEIVSMMRLGEKWSVSIPPEMAYGAQDRGPIPANSTLIFEMELLSIAAPQKPADVSGIEAQTMESGVKYYILQEGTGEKSQMGDMIEFSYTGFTVTGEVFEHSGAQGRPLPRTIMGRQPMMPGWQENLVDMKVGEKRQVIVPASLIDRPLRGIPPNTDLTFEFEIVSASTPTTPTPFDISGAKEQTNAEGMKYYILSDQGEKIPEGQPINIDVTMYEAEGKIMQSTIEEGKPIAFVLGATPNPLFTAILREMTTEGKGRFYPSSEMSGPGAPQGMYIDVQILK